MNIEYIMLVTHHICITKILPDISQIMPFSLTGYFVPTFKRHSGIFVFRLFIEKP